MRCSSMGGVRFSHRLAIRHGMRARSARNARRGECRCCGPCEGRAILLGRDVRAGFGRGDGRERLRISASRIRWPFLKFRALEKEFACEDGSPSAPFAETDGVVVGLRAVKDADEIRRMRAAQAITDAGFSPISSPS